VRLAFSILIALASCLGDGESRSQVTQSGTAVVSWVPVPAPMPFNQLFELDVTWIGSDGTLPDAASTIVLDALMPAHGHGMQTAPVVEITGPGQARVKGMKLHMRGIWEFRFTLQTQAGQDLATFTEDVQ